MSSIVVALEGPVGVGKTTLGRAASERLDIGFIDGDDYSAPGPWLRSILQTSRWIADACELKLESYPAVIMAYPLRCTNWIFFKETFRRRGIAFYCISLTADLSHISNRERILTSDEVDRASQMLIQGYLRAYLAGHAGQVMPSRLRKVLAGSELHRAWLVSFLGFFEQDGVAYGPCKPVPAELRFPRRFYSLQWLIAVGA